MSNPMETCEICRKCKGSRYFTAEIDIDNKNIRIRINFDGWLTMCWVCLKCAKNILASLSGHGIVSIVSSPLRLDSQDANKLR